MMPMPKIEPPFSFIVGDTVAHNLSGPFGTIIAISGTPADNPTLRWYRIAWQSSISNYETDVLQPTANNHGSSDIMLRAVHGLKRW